MCTFAILPPIAVQLVSGLRPNVNTWINCNSNMAEVRPTKDY